MTGPQKNSKKLTNDEISNQILDVMGFSLEEKENFIKITSENKKLFDKDIAKAVEGGKILIPRTRFLEWAFLVHDYNRMHIFDDYAQEAGYEKALAHGTLIAAHAEQYALGFMSAVNNLVDRVNEERFGEGESKLKKLIYNGHSIKFIDPLYPRRRKAKMNFNLEKILGSVQELNLNFSGYNQKDAQIVFCPIVSLGYERKEISQKEVIARVKLGDEIERSSIEIKKEEMVKACQCLGLKPGNELLKMHYSAFLAATLLRIASRKTGDPEGTYRKIDLDFYNEPNLGIFETVVKMPKPPGVVETNEGKMYRYKFEALCIQDDIPIFGGKAVCLSPAEYKL